MPSTEHTTHFDDRVPSFPPFSEQFYLEAESKARLGVHIRPEEIRTHSSQRDFFPPLKLLSQLSNQQQESLFSRDRVRFNEIVNCDG